MSNQKTVLNHVTERWLRPTADLSADVDCGQCTMSLKDPKHVQRWHLYKCCTFQPFVANIYCGAMLEAGISPFPDTNKAVMRPLGVIATREFRELCEATPDEERGEPHLCSYYDRTERRCGIWQFRPGECSLYFCGPLKPERETFSKRVFQLESGLAQMALVYLGFTPAEISDQVEELNDPGTTLASLSPARARELYRAAWEWAKTQSESDVRSWLSFDNQPAGG